MQNGIPRRALAGSILETFGAPEYDQILLVSIVLAGMAVLVLGWALAAITVDDPKMGSGIWATALLN